MHASYYKCTHNQMLQLIVHKPSGSPQSCALHVLICMHFKDIFVYGADVSHKVYAVQQLSYIAT